MADWNATIAGVLITITLLHTPVPAENVDPGAAESVYLWPDRSDAAPYAIMPATGDGVIRLTNIANPALTFYPANAAAGPAAAILVCPGGGYTKLAYNKEGTEVAAWLNSLGIAAAVLKYRVPDNRDGALADAQRALGILRSRARDWNVDPDRVGILGFSAGGHLASRLSTNYNERVYEAVDVADAESCKPAFTILVYPAYIAGDGYKTAPEISVSSETSPAFIVQTQDDAPYVNSSIAYYIALKDAGVPAELHLYPEGGHGYGMRPSEHAVAGWPALVARWLKTIQVLRD